MHHLRTCYSNKNVSMSVLSVKYDCIANLYTIHGGDLFSLQDLQQTIMSSNQWIRLLLSVEWRWRLFCFIASRNDEHLVCGSRLFDGTLTSAEPIIYANKEKWGETWWCWQAELCHLLSLLSPLLTHLSLFTVHCQYKIIIHHLLFVLFSFSTKFDLNYR